MKFCFLFASLSACVLNRFASTYGWKFGVDLLDQLMDGFADPCQLWLELDSLIYTSQVAHLKLRRGLLSIVAN